jgi:hypothetical protein
MGPWFEERRRSHTCPPQDPLRLEVAERIMDPVERRLWLTFVIVGAGPTGVEFAGAIAEIARQTLKNDLSSILWEQPSGRIVAVWAKRPECPLANRDSE